MTTKTLATKCGGYQVKNEIAELSNTGQAWKNSTKSFRGETGHASNWTGFGSLPTEFHESAGSATYTIYSYATPIAWLTSEGEWVQPAVRYSLTTSNHQGALYRLQARSLSPADPKTATMRKSRYGSRRSGW